MPERKLRADGSGMKPLSAKIPSITLHPREEWRGFIPQASGGRKRTIMDPQS